MSGEFTEFFNRLPLIELTDEVESRDFPPKDGKPARKSLNQHGYLIQVDSRGTQLKRSIRVDLGRAGIPYAPGLYVLDGVSLNGNQWGDLEMLRFGVRLASVPQIVQTLLQQEAKRAA
ncbi:hypothetical protein CKO27_12905 [Thiocystis violacea]|nr:G5P family DNA-binding protein [Thiocystis violacea]MBK1718528.1 hypothetical protein [Thiocystis violacea]